MTLDAGLIDVTNAEAWTSQVYGLGAVGELADLSERNIGTRLINAEVVAYGAASGLLRGRIAALFFRHHSIGGYDELTDFLIAPLPGTPSSHPGDSGTVWHLLTADVNEKPPPIALQWGGQGFLNAGAGTTFNFALAAACPTCCACSKWSWSPPQRRRAAVLGEDRPLQHRHARVFASRLSRLEDPAQCECRSHQLPRSGPAETQGDRHGTKEAKKNRDFVPMADVPDVIWKNMPHRVVNGEVKGVFGGRDTGFNTGPEHPTHFADIDEPKPATGRRSARPAWPTRRTSV